MSWGERWLLLILVELLTLTQWVKLRGDFCWYWWNCWPSLNELRWEVILNSFSDGQQFHQYQQKSPLISTHWVMVNNSTNINKHHLSLQLIQWWSTIPPPISTKITPLFNSFNELNRGVIFVDIGGGIVDHHSMSWSERWFLLILVELLTITQWDLSPQVIEWWSTIQLISTNITSHFNSFSDGQQFHHQYQQKSPLYSTHWVVIIDITQWVDVRGDFCWYWWNCLPSINELRWEVIFIDIGGIIDHHSMS
jgi:hypothetical protein